MQNVIKIEGLNTEQVQEAYKHLYDEYGLEMSAWSEVMLKSKIENFWKKRSE